MSHNPDCICVREPRYAHRPQPRREQPREITFWPGLRAENLRLVETLGFVAVLGDGRRIRPPDDASRAARAWLAAHKGRRTEATRAVRRALEAVAR